MDSIVMTAKTAEEALEKALKRLDATIDEVDVEIADTGSKGFLGFGQKPAKVIVKLKDDPVKAAKKFIREVSAAMGLDIAVTAELSGKQMNIGLKGQNIGVLIGKHGQTLDSLQYLTSLVVNKNKDQYVNIIIDTENYRAKRRETLENLAKNMARKVRTQKRAVRLEPMSPSERRIIHAALQGEKQISTFSEGVEPFRNVVISYKRQEYKKQEAGSKRQETGYKRQDNYDKFITTNDEE